MSETKSDSQAPRRTVPLALALLAIVGALVAVIAGVVIAEGYRRSLDVAMEMGQRLFENLRTDIAVQQQQMVQPVEFALAILSQDASLGAGHAEGLQTAFMAVLENNPQLTELRVAYAGGELFAVALLAGMDESLKTSISPPPDAIYAARRVAHGADGTWTLTWTFVSPERAVLGTTSAPTAQPHYDAEPWYSAAAAARGMTVQTKASVIPAQRAVGISFARSFAGSTPGVIAADVSLARLSSILTYLKFDDEDQIFLFDDDRNLIASPDAEVAYEGGDEIKQTTVAALPHPVVRVLMDRFEASGSYASEIVKSGNTDFLASVIRLGEEVEGRPNTFLAFATPARTFTGQFVDIARETAIISLLILLAAAPIVVFVARRVARPLTALERITDAIAHLDMTDVVGEPTRIREIDHLGRSIGNMRNALGQITKFVPKALLQELIKSGTNMSVGGERRELSFVFTDVLDFTPMAESMPAEALMAQMSRYFDALVGEILANRGTIDKYVGDAIFAFWNAPALQTDHAMLACKSALACRAASNRLNEHWKSEGRPVWYTRFGVHLGEAVVGNVGSRDRLDYTAIGSAINLGARLEGLNKFYGTQILVSGAIKDAVGDRFLFRPIDRVVAKGATTPMAVFELLCLREDASAELAARCAAWSDAYNKYRTRDWQGAHTAVSALAQTDPNDAVAARFRDRITELLAAPLGDWNGVTRFDTK